MEIHTENPEAPFNFDQKLQPLFDAMKAGKLIKSVTCFKGIANENYPEKDFTIENFRATQYWHGIARSREGSPDFDYVDTDSFKMHNDGYRSVGFYMNMVKTFEI